jgi:hypothetical protein
VRGERRESHRERQSLAAYVGLVAVKQNWLTAK